MNIRSNSDQIWPKLGKFGRSDQTDLIFWGPGPTDCKFLATPEPLSFGLGKMFPDKICNASEIAFSLENGGKFSENFVFFLEKSAGCFLKIKMRFFWFLEIKIWPKFGVRILKNFQNLWTAGLERSTFVSARPFLRPRGCKVPFRQDKGVLVHTGVRWVCENAKPRPSLLWRDLQSVGNASRIPDWLAFFRQKSSLKWTFLPRQKVVVSLLYIYSNYEIVVSRAIRTPRTGWSQKFLPTCSICFKNRGK